MSNNADSRAKIANAYDRMTDLALAHLLLDDDSHPLYQCNLDQVLELAGLDSRETAKKCVREPLAPLLAKLQSHEHLRPERQAHVEELLLSAWAEQVIPQMVDGLRACKPLDIRRDTEKFRIEFKITPITDVPEASNSSGLRDLNDSGIDISEVHTTPIRGIWGRTASGTFDEDAGSEFESTVSPRRRKRIPGTCRSPDSDGYANQGLFDEEGAIYVSDDAASLPHRKRRHEQERTRGGGDADIVTPATISSQNVADDSAKAGEHMRETLSLRDQSTSAKPSLATSKNRGGRPKGSKDKHRRIGRPNERKGTTKYDITRPPNVAEKRWDQMESQKIAVWHAHRINDTDYGRTATQACDRCCQEGLTCCVYKDWRDGAKTCGECKKTSMACRNGEYEALMTRSRRRTVDSEQSGSQETHSS